LDAVFACVAARKNDVQQPVELECAGCYTHGMLFWLVCEVCCEMMLTFWVGCDAGCGQSCWYHDLLYDRVLPAGAWKRGELYVDGLDWRKLGERGCVSRGRVKFCIYFWLFFKYRFLTFSKYAVIHPKGIKSFTTRLHT
jgi:hypothetical protein